MGSRESDITTNFRKEPTGNSLLFGEKELTITVSDNPRYVASVLYKRLSFGRKKVIQFEQTGRKSNPSLDTVTFEMTNPDGSPMERGKYRVVTRYDNGFGDQGHGDNFEII